jgi:nucleotide-binding universal stress UspA family protein
MKVLLAIDDSDCSNAAVRMVAEHYRPSDAEVKALHVVEWPKDMPAYIGFAEGAAAVSAILEMHEERRRQGRSLVTGVVEQLKAAGFPATCEVREGDARRAILECAAEWSPDIIVLGSHGRKGLNRLFLGSVSEHVVRQAPCSVHVVR